MSKYVKNLISEDIAKQLSGIRHRREASELNVLVVRHDVNDVVLALYASSAHRRKQHCAKYCN